MSVDAAPAQLRQLQDGSLDQRPSFYDEIALSPSVDNPKRLVFIANRAAGKMPDRLLTLRREFEKAARVVSILFEGEVEARRDIFLVLHVAADRGLRGPNYNIEDGQVNLDNVRDIIIDAAHKIRDSFLRQYSILLVVVGLLPLGIGISILLTGAFGLLTRPAPGGTYDPVFAWSLAVFWIPAGAAISVWGDFAFRMQAGLTYDKLLQMDPSRWRPTQRLMITIGIAFIFAYLLAFDAVQVGVGGILLNDFSTKTPLLALAVGGTTGLAFAAVQDIVFRMRPSTK
jgi:hypothetical protein